MLVTWKGWRDADEKDAEDDGGGPRKGHKRKSKPQGKGKKAVERNYFEPEECVELANMAKLMLSNGELDQEHEYCRHTLANNNNLYSDEADFRPMTHENVDYAALEKILADPNAIEKHYSNYSEMAKATVRGHATSVTKLLTLT